MNTRESALVQLLADNAWRLDRVFALEMGIYPSTAPSLALSPSVSLIAESLGNCYLDGPKDRDIGRTSGRLFETLA
jgi:hypothetical protein